MLTPIQFAALAAAALPAAALAQASVVCHSQAGTFYTFYQATYQVPRSGQAVEVVGPEMGCPFAALIHALEEVYCLNLVSPRAYFQAVATVQQAEQAPAHV